MKHKTNQNKTDGDNSAQTSLDETDAKILQIMQDDFPIVQKPWLEISGRLRISENEVVTRLKRLIEIGAIQRIGPVFDSSKIGLKAATLVAMKVPRIKLTRLLQS